MTAKIDYKKETERMLGEASRRMAEYIAHSSFEFWQRKDFRLYVKFQILSQTEQDRMFNELEVSVLGLFILGLDDSIKKSTDEKEIVFSMLRKQIPAQFLEIMKEAGVEKQHLSTWKKLIDMRFKEYREDVKLARKTSKAWNELGDDEHMQEMWSRVETITIDCLTHIRRGDVKEDDPLWKLLRKWLTSLEATSYQLTSLGGEEPPIKN